MQGGGWAHRNHPSGQNPISRSNTKVPSFYLTESECQKLNKEAASADKYENMRFELECSGKNHFKLKLPGKGECIIGWWLMYLMAGGPDCIIANV